LRPSAGDSEQVLDIAQTIGMAPGLSEVRVYIGVSDYNILNKIASENLARQISISWSWSPDDPLTVDPIFEEFAAQGQSVFVASGDSGAYSPSPAEEASARMDFRFPGTRGESPLRRMAAL
jgi:subtilase family serine protease